jgi:predicted ester cyclase
MSIESNKAVVRRYYEEVLNRGNLGLLETIVRPDYVEHDPLPGQGAGIAGLRKRVEMLRDGLKPEFTIEQTVAEGDTVVVRWTNRGRHVGPFLGMQPTNKSFTIAGIDIHMMEEGKLAEHHHVVDQLSMLQQLGLVPGGG